ncbi:hypothetical protein SUGI_0856790 [Cryptomeria japonica]|nr:hypothetical protein SUGI_0856790 [Cryptomeria japonica]
MKLKLSSIFAKNNVNHIPHSPVRKPISSQICDLMHLTKNRCEVRVGDHLSTVVRKCGVRRTELSGENATEERQDERGRCREEVSGGRAGWDGSKAESLKMEEDGYNVVGVSDAITVGLFERPRSRGHGEKGGFQGWRLQAKRGRR